MWRHSSNDKTLNLVWAALHELHSSPLWVRHSIKQQQTVIHRCDIMPCNQFILVQNFNAKPASCWTSLIAQTQISASSTVRFLCNLCSREQVLNNNIVVILYLGTKQYVTFFLLLCLIYRMQSDWRGRSCRSKWGSFPKAICRKACQCRRSQCLHLLSNLCWWWKSKTFSKGKL